MVALTKAQETANKTKLETHNLTEEDGSLVKITTFESRPILDGVGAGKTAKIITRQAFLPSPQMIQADYPKDWGAESTMDTSNGIWNAAKSEMLRLGYKSAEIMTPDRAFSEGRFQKGIALNEKKKLLFNSIDFRNFNFSILLQPKDIGQAGEIKGWIGGMKRDSAPSLNGGDNTFFQFPKFFILEWPTLNNLFKTGPMACTNISVNYTPEGIWSQHRDGVPTATRVDLAFTEIDIPTRERIEEGW